MIMRCQYGWHVTKIYLCHVEESVDGVPLPGQPCEHTMKMRRLGPSHRILVMAADLGNRTTKWQRRHNSAQPRLEHGSRKQRTYEHQRLVHEPGKHIG